MDENPYKSPEASAPKPPWRAIGYVIGPTIWASSLALLAYGLLVRAWYGYVFAAIFIACGMAILVCAHRLRKWQNAEMKRLRKKYAELD
jgi:hypothetical protein